MTFKLTRSLFEQLFYFASQKIPQEVQCGVVFGFNDDDQIFCVGCANTESIIPLGLNVVGAYHLNSQLSQEDLVDSCKRKAKSKKSGEMPIFTPAVDGTQLLCKRCDLESMNISDSEFEVIKNEEFIKHLLVINLKGTIPIEFQFHSERSVCKKNIQTSITKIKDELKTYKFKLSQSSFEIFSKSPKSIKSNVLSDLYNHLEDSDLFDGVEVAANMKQKMLEKIRKQKAAEKAPLTFKIENDVKEDESRENVLIVNEQETIVFKLPIYLLMNIYQHETIDTLLKSFLSGLQRILDSFASCLLEFANFLDRKIYLPKVYNFFHESAPFFISILYPESIDDENLIKTRKELHLKYLLPLDKPYIRKGNRYLLDEREKSDYLYNVHLGLAKSDMKNGKVSTVYGNYVYHHYMQDKIDDNGWGCAYRSLQTIVSWFKLQGYVDKDVPTHKEIQQALVDVGDKQPSFVDSRQWIGSQEVSYVLNHLYGITSKIMFVSSGADLANKGRELQHHFASQGTPIMIGGGVLAHTIIGVDFDENTGDMRFLILDPHYTGSEDLSVILKKGWCGWKQPSFWDKNSFYNLCMPQRPSGF